MLSRIIGRIKCVFGKHERWKKYAKLDDDGNYVANCRFCGVGMRQDRRRNWTVAD